MIRVPVYMNEEILRYKKTIEKLTHKLNRKPRQGEIAKKMKISVGKVRELDNYIAKMSSLDAPIGEAGDGPSRQQSGHGIRCRGSQPRAARRDRTPGMRNCWEVNLPIRHQPAPEIRRTWARIVQSG